MAEAKKEASAGSTAKKTKMKKESKCCECPTPVGAVNDGSAATTNKRVLKVAVGGSVCVDHSPFGAMGMTGLTGYYT